MSDDMTLAGWRAALDESDDCPWPGPRPLTEEDHELLLCGRARDQRAFRQAVDQHKVVILGGRTGIGKSSLLLRGLVPALNAEGYLVLPCRDWSGAAGQSDAAEFLAHRIRGSVIASARWVESEVPTGAALFPFLQEELKGNAVLVLDQFEELIRDAPAFTAQLYAALSFLNQRTDLKVIISLRSEYDHELRPLVLSLRPMTFTTYVLDEIEDEYADAIVLAANEFAPGAVDEEFAAYLAEAWRTARRAVGPAEVGLLHLQAMLFVLFVGSDHTTVDRGVFDRFVKSQGVRIDASDAAGLFTAALTEAVDVKMDRCKAAAIELGLDSYLVEGTTRLVGRIVRHLSSAGYKLVREAFDLAELALEDDLLTLRRGIAGARQEREHDADGAMSIDQERALLQLFIACLSGDARLGEEQVDLFDRRPVVAAAADQLVNGEMTWVERLHPGADPKRVDPRGSTSGPMLGLAPAAAMIEELRRVAFALEWLRKAQLVRLSTPRAGTVMVALIHDGFGSALAKWATSDALSPCGAIYGLTAPPAGDFMWKKASGEHLRELDGTTAEKRKVRVFVNLRWRGAFISADFRRVLFVNCDFRGSQFANCTFEGVTFVNCLLDGLLITDCTVVGAAAVDDDDEWLDEPDVFEIAGVADVASVLGRYREDDTAREILLASKPQLPAIPADHRDGRRRMKLHTEGLVVYGGRTSSLLIRRCRFAEGQRGDDGRVSLRETAGSGVDIVEHSDAGRYEIQSSALRHVTFTSSPTASGGGGELAISLEKSVIYQLWLGSDLRGKLTATGSILLHAWNGSPNLSARLVMADDGQANRFHGLVGFEFDGEQLPIDPQARLYTADELDGDLELRTHALGMDYRENAYDAQQNDVLG